MATETKPRARWTPEFLGEFEALVQAGREVSTVGLSGRIGNAHSLVGHFEDNQLVAVAAVKNPLASYRAKLRKGTGYELAVERFRYEVGWLYVVPEHQGKRLSRKLMEACLLAAGSDGVFATTREDNERMQKTLKRYGFVQAGKPYKPERDKVWLKLFVREGA